MIYLYYLILVCTSQSILNQENLNYFTKEDTDNDGILTTTQFITALTNLFKKSVIDTQNLEKSKENCNNFGREFLGKKKTKGSIKISDINSWITSHELETAYNSWKSNSQKPHTPSNPSPDLSPPSSPPPSPPPSPSLKPLKSNFPDF